jgi:hypothetical protein
MGPSAKVAIRGHDGHRSAGLLFEGADRLDSRQMVVMAAVAEIEPEDVDSGNEQGLDHLRRRAGGTQGGHHLGLAVAAEGMVIGLHEVLPAGWARAKRREPP